MKVCKNYSLYLRAFWNLSLLVLLSFASGCDWIYKPESQPQPGSTSNQNAASLPHLFSVNHDQQICNPTASQDTMNFKGCMLFLNLEGALNLKVSPEWESAYLLTNAGAHDRLTIVDTMDTVRWFLMKPGFIPQTEMQKPRWSRHPDYISFLGDNDFNSDGYVVRISDKAVLKVNTGLLQANSTTHLWLPDHFKGPSGLARNAVPALFSPAGATWDSVSGLVDKATIRAFFNTDSVKFVFSKNKASLGLTIYYIDYSQVNPTVVEVPRPQGKDGYDCESAQISPDGNWIVYNCRRGSVSCEAYMQYLGFASEAVLLHDGMAAEPHWWLRESTGELFVEYCTKPGPLEVHLDLVPADGSSGETLIRKIAAGPEWLSLHDPESILTSLPFQGGLTRDGGYLVTGYIYGYILGFPSIGM